MGVIFCPPLPDMRGAVLLGYLHCLVFLTVYTSPSSIYGFRGVRCVFFALFRLDRVHDVDTSLLHHVRFDLIGCASPLERTLPGTGGSAPGSSMFHRSRWIQQWGNGAHDRTPDIYIIWLTYVRIHLWNTTYGNWRAFLDAMCVRLFSGHWSEHWLTLTRKWSTAVERTRF